MGISYTQVPHSKCIGQALGLELPHNTPASSRHTVATLYYEYASFTLMLPATSKQAPWSCATPSARRRAWSCRTRWCI